MSLANAEDHTEAKKGPSLVIQIGVMAALTMLAVGGGWVAGMYLKTGSETEPTTQKVSVEPVMTEMPGETEAHGGGEGKDEDGEAKPVPRLVPLEPITTNLSAPADIWVRMELSMVFAATPDPELVRHIHQDILAYMRTVTLQQVQGASGFQHLKTDIEERASIRSNGLARELVIRTLLFE
ncbi:flagellar basal body-associated protein FliL [Nitratireductor sp. CAU 1489]|uniref:Flagellar protein FliL n=1 Tax=Nitratireductor arenosus TaxID=2682096 RepID=A0A844QHA3_9HYPH|nr:flagellar basal body-associated FliL family protein [Nitratireductor arenosus]MVA99306.1 flagellar basal body-associated protein FliL [Nitratireductor arenosus]